MGKDKKCPTCKLNPAVYKLVVGLLAEWERNIPRMADETPAENSLRALGRFPLSPPPRPRERPPMAKPGQRLIIKFHRMIGELEYVQNAQHDRIEGADHERINEAKGLLIEVMENLEAAQEAP